MLIEYLVSILESFCRVVSFSSEEKKTSPQAKKESTSAPRQSYRSRDHPMSSPKEGGASSSISIGRASPFGRSVLDYVTPRELDQALQHQRQSSLSKMEEIAAQAAANKNAPSEAEKSSDWKLPIPDPDTEQQSAEAEVQRLLTLKSYMVLDAEKEDAFDQLTREAREVFGFPTSLISLIDLGRQFLFRYVVVH